MKVITEIEPEDFQVIESKADDYGYSSFERWYAINNGIRKCAGLSFDEEDVEEAKEYL